MEMGRYDFMPTFFIYREMTKIMIK